MTPPMRESVFLVAALKPAAKSPEAVAAPGKQLTKRQQARQAALQAKREAKKADKLAARQAAKKSAQAAKKAEKHARAGVGKAKTAPAAQPGAKKAGK